MQTAVIHREGRRARHYFREELRSALTDARRRLHLLISGLTDAQWQVPHRAGVNPIAWEAGHIAWFDEFWTQRGPHRVGDDGFVCAARPPIVAGPDETFDSARLPHAARWTTPMPERAEIEARLDRTLASTLAALDALDETDEALYFHRLALFHADMHNEAFIWMRATLGFVAPVDAVLPRMGRRTSAPIAGGKEQIGWPADAGGFAFDNECAGMEVELAPYEIDSAPVVAGEYLAFVTAGGYDQPAYWPGDAGRWRAEVDRSHPERWRRSDGKWEVRWFDRWLPLDPQQPVIHVSAYEAEAYCRWAKRRLPRAAEWECAALDGRMEWGASVWEWTAEPFVPYPGFVPGPYRDYSAPWFNTHRELRGGSFATHPRLHHARYRNFFTPERCDVFAGFRTAAL